MPQNIPLLFGNSNIPAKERFLFRTVFVFEELPLNAVSAVGKLQKKLTTG
jgi:hypothetical protein